MEKMINRWLSAGIINQNTANVLLADVRPIVCFSKYDLMTEEEQNEFNSIINYYNAIGIKAFINTEKNLACHRMSLAKSYL